MAFSVHDRLLIQCSRVAPSARSIETAAGLLSHDLDWDYLVETSIRHAVTPLFYHGLQQVEEGIGRDLGIPHDVRQRLCDLYRGSKARNTRLYRVIDDIAAAFARDEIPLMGLKDLQLAWQVYPDIGLRPMGDVDLLIHPQDYRRASDCLAGLGFLPQPGPDIPYTRKYAWAHHFRRAADDVWADVQWNVMQLEWDVYGEGNFDFDIDRMWQGGVPMTISTAALMVPRPEDMLFHLCLHLEGHQYAELILLCDIAELLIYYQGQLDWPYLVGLARRYRVESSLYYALWLVQRLFQADQPPSLWQEGTDVSLGLAPAYFKAGMFEPLFGNLTTLHLVLDEIRQAAHPPAAAMAEFEATARLQAAAAMHLYRELDAITSAFLARGGCLAIVEGSPSERILPDLLLRPFEEIRLLILDQDLDILCDGLEACGFASAIGYPGARPGSPRAHTGDRGASRELPVDAYARQTDIVSCDPILDGRTPRLAIHVDHALDLQAVLPSLDAQPRSKKEIALGVVKARLAGRRGTPDVLVRLRVVTLSPEEMLLYLSARLGRREHGRLFGLTYLLEFFRRYQGPIRWDRVAVVAGDHNLSDAVGDGLAMAAELLPGDARLAGGALDCCNSSGAQPHVFKMARYSLDSLGLYTDLKAPFLYTLGLLALPGVRARAQYLLRSLAGTPEYSSGGRKQHAILPRLLSQTVAGVLRRIWPRRDHLSGDSSAITGMAYWVESVPVETPTDETGKSL